MPNMELGLICKNKLKVPLKGKLKLPLPFVLEYGSSLPQKLFIELPSGEVWFGKYVKRSDYIEGLEDLISFYGIKPYHMVVMHYSGGPYFKFNIFNECGVEIFYPFSCNSSCKLRARRNDPYFVVSSTIALTEFEIDKMTATCTVNALHNFLVLHEILIQKSHLAKKCKYEVMSCKEFEKFGMDEEMKTIDFSFKDFYWTIEIQRRNGHVYFDHGWYDFVNAANISEGDICVIQMTGDPSTFEIAVLPNNLLRQWSSTPDDTITHHQFSWYKKLKGSALERGTLEIPRLFAMRMGRQLGRKIEFVCADGRKFRGKYSVSINQISGLKEMISAYDIYDNCVIIFYYVGQSTFNVSIYDSPNVDHLKDITGEFMADIVRKIEMEEIRDGRENGDGSAGGGHLAISDEDEVDDVVLIEQGSHLFEAEGNETDPEHPPELNHELDFPVELNNVFVVELKKSHFQEKCRGVYCSTHCYELYENWNSGTIVNLNFEGETFGLGVQRNNRTCRFGKGWDEFVRKTEVHHGQLLEFRIIPPYSIEVSKIN